MNSYEMVTEFHQKFGHPVADEPVVLKDERATLRLSLILEEALELAEAYGFRTEEVESHVSKMLARGPERPADVVAVADALSDLEYVTNGAAVEQGMPLPELVERVHESNMSKLGEDGKPIYREDGKIMKGPSYSPPDFTGLI